MAQIPTETPVMKQYLEIKQNYPDCVLFFRMGDFYEMFFEDATYAAHVLDLTLTSRDKSREDAIPMCGIPYHSAKQYIAKLIELGKKVALCEQIEDPKLAKKIVRRAVTQVITPGTVLEEDLLVAKSNRYLVAMAIEQSGSVSEPYAGIAHLDISTAEFGVTCVPLSQAAEEVARLAPVEMLWVGTTDEQSKQRKDMFLSKLALTIPVADAPVASLLDNTTLLKQSLQEDLGQLQRYFADTTRQAAACQAAAACVRYVKSTQPQNSSALLRIRTYMPADELLIDDATRAHLELFTVSGERRTKGSLLWVIDETQTAFGGRMLRQWLSAPLQSIAGIRRRQDAVAWFIEQPTIRLRVQEQLKGVHDLERLVNRVVFGVATPRDLAKLGESLRALPGLALLFQQAARSAPGALPELLHLQDDLCIALAQQLNRAFVENPPISTKDGGYLQKGYHAALDDLIDLTMGGKQKLIAMEERERQRTGISSLKISYNRVFGYYFEISRTHLAKVPADYTRKQTLANAERFITQELSEYESQILEAEQRRTQMELELFAQLCKDVLDHSAKIFSIAQQVAHLDALSGLAEVAHRYGYVRPEVTDGNELFIEEGRHPVVERLLDRGTFIPNDIRLDPADRQLCILTGPNMAGKSTIMRQIALISILAQMGSFVPAKKAKLGLLDRVFTRIGASDNLGRGESTFMVEMRETAHILAHASKRSLVLLDEIGRGTSTYDGLSIAWAVAEYLHDAILCKTLFATHYHELCALSQSHPRAFNLSVAVQQWKGEVVFLHRLVEGGANRSYGVEVARLAQLPKGVIERAKELLKMLEQGQPQVSAEATSQLGLFSPRPQTTAVSVPVQNEEELFVLQQLRQLSLDDLTPRQALALLQEWKEKV